MSPVLPWVLRLLAAFLLTARIQAARIEIGNLTRTTIASARVDESSQEYTFRCDGIVQDVIAQMEQLKQTMFAIEGACGEGVDCLSDKSPDNVLDDIADAGNAEALVESAEALQIKLRGVEECGSLVSLEALKVGISGISQDIRQALENLASKTTKVKQIVENTRYEADKTLLPEVFKFVEDSGDLDLKASVKGQLMQRLNTDAEVRRDPPENMLPQREDTEDSSASLAIALADAPSYSSIMREKLNGAVRRMWCNRPDKMCKQRSARHGSIHRSCYRVVQDGAVLAGSTYNPLDLEAKPIQIRKLVLTPELEKTSEDGEWGLCLVGHREKGGSKEATQAHFEKVKETYWSWQQMGASGSALVQVHSQSNNSTALQTGNIFLTATNVVSTTIYFGLSLVTWLTDYVFKIAFAFWEVGSYFFGLLLGDKIRWMLMQPACIVYQAVMFVPDLVRVIAGNVMNWVTQMQHSGFGGEKVEWSNANEISRLCFDNYPQSATVLRPMQLSDADKEAVRVNNIRLKDDMARDRQTTMYVTNGIPHWSKWESKAKERPRPRTRRK